MSKKILLVDDDIDLVELNKTYLEKNGYDVVSAYNGTEGMEKVKQARPDIIVLDVMMDEVGEGFEVARSLKNNENYKNIPIIMLTSVNQEHDFNITLGADEEWNPVDYFLDKPFGPQKLLAKINEIVSK